MTPLDAVNLLLLVAAGGLLLPIAVFSLECLAAVGRVFQLVWRDGRVGKLVLPGADDGPRPRTAVLIPAHDEQAVIEPTLRAILPSLVAGDRLLVVADNCTDETAALARRTGAEVVERTDPQRRGKGYALQYGIDALRADPPAVVMVVDADCLVEPQMIDVLARLAHETQRPIQARNLTEVDPWGEHSCSPWTGKDACPATGHQAVSILANRFTNLVRPLGLKRLGVPCRLTGTGMAFPWPLMAEVQPSGGNLVEDMQLGIDLALRDHRPLYVAEVGVTSGLPAPGRAFAAQRTRWEQGHLRTAVRQVPRLLAAGLRRRSWPLLAMAADLSIPPLALLATLWLALAAISGLAWRLGGSGLPLMLLAGGGAAMGLSLALGWAVYCRRQVPLTALLAVPALRPPQAADLRPDARPPPRRLGPHGTHLWCGRRHQRARWSAALAGGTPAPQAVLGRPLGVDYTSHDDAARHDHAEPGDAAPHRAGAAAVLRAGSADP